MSDGEKGCAVASGTPDNRETLAPASGTGVPSECKWAAADPVVTSQPGGLRRA